MSTAESRKTLRSLLCGIDPISGEELPKKQLYRHPMLLKAFQTALRHMAGFQAFRNSKPTNAGKIWTKLEERQLECEFKDVIKEIAELHGRSPGAITSRIIKLNLLEGDHYKAQPR